MYSRIKKNGKYKHGKYEKLCNKLHMFQKCRFKKQIRKKMNRI